MRRMLLIAAAISLGAAPVARAAALAVVMAIDVSASVTAGSFVLQRDGIAHAFADPRLVEAISAAPDGVDVLVLEWSDPDAIETAVGWTHVSDRDSAAHFARMIHRAKRGSRGATAIGPALAAAAAQFDHLPHPAARRVIDISGDGIANLGEPPQAVRDRIAKTGITINGLAILARYPWLEAYYRRNVIAGLGAFVLAAKDFDSFSEAMLQKLLAEVAGADRGRPTAGQMQ